MEKNNLEIAKTVWERASNQLESFMKLKGEFLENDYVELVGDTSKLIGFAKKASALISQKKFEYFLKGFNSDSVPTEEQIEKLTNYINNEQRAEFISDSFSKILLSKSTKACLIMGILLNSIIEKDKDVSYKELVCFNALLNFYDDDINNFDHIFRFISINSKRGFASLNGATYNNYIINENLDKVGVQLTIDKCMNFQILSEYSDIDSSFDEDDISMSSVELEKYHKVTDPGEMLFNLISKLSNNP
ncbi:hypothetical protein [Paenibacillus polymyxa]|uniref:hypothetical protein n=1 Tax=Paenibacillus polymyxa TaxID=1406 RepID=UPI001C9DEDF1|nr:hypothetical protein [Paenibacillus polymyxa]MBY7736290.1 hypothetical protein [Paenibacillus polymyxa]